MTDFRKYDHVERLGHDEVEGIDLGTVYVFPKLDGTNASIWRRSPHLLGAGSRNRLLSDDSDNHGFHQWVQKQDNIREFLELFPNWTLYGEWLVPHTLKTYRSDVWRRFWVFDVYDWELGRYLSFDEYATTLHDAGIDVIFPLAKFNNPSEEQLRKEVEMNTYLIDDGCGAGEGIVIKNYDWRNKFGRQPWAKIVRNEFKESNKLAFGVTEKHGEFQVEAAVAEEFVTKALVDKTRAKIVAEGCNDRKILIPRLLQTVFYDVVREDCWTFVKKHKYPVIDFKKLQRHCILWTKKHAEDLF
jgi:hypothetical protein